MVWTAGRPATTPVCRTTTTARPWAALRHQGPAGPVALLAEVLADRQFQQPLPIDPKLGVPSDLMEILGHGRNIGASRGVMITSSKGGLIERLARSVDRGFERRRRVSLIGRRTHYKQFSLETLAVQAYLDGGQFCGDT